MTRINLLPPEIKGKAEKVNLAPWIIISLLAVVVLVGVFWLFFHGQVTSKEDELKALEEELQDLQKKVEEPLMAYEEQASELQSIEALYAACNAGRVGWASMLNDLALYVPEGLTTASNRTAPAIWLTALTIDATPLESSAQAASSEPSIMIAGYAAPAWLCIQTWLPRASDFKAHGFLDAYPYYYYFRGQPKVAEFFVRLQNMEEWSNLWISSSTQELISYSIPVPQTNQDGSLVYDEETGILKWTNEEASDWAINFQITGYWDAKKAPWSLKSGETGTETGTETETTSGGSTESSTSTSSTGGSGE